MSSARTPYAGARRDDGCGRDMTQSNVWCHIISFPFRPERRICAYVINDFIFFRHGRSKGWLIYKKKKFNVNGFPLSSPPPGSPPFILPLNMKSVLSALLLTVRRSFWPNESYYYYSLFLPFVFSACTL